MLLGVKLFGFFGQYAIFLLQTEQCLFELFCSFFLLCLDRCDLLFIELAVPAVAAAAIVDLVSEVENGGMELLVFELQFCNLLA